LIDQAPGQFKYSIGTADNGAPVTAIALASSMRQQCRRFSAVAVRKILRRADVGSERRYNAAAVAKIYANLKIPAEDACKCKTPSVCLAANGRRSIRYFRFGYYAFFM
jgi:hypothetical protein